MNEEDFAVVTAMEQYGGSFVRQLAALCHRADAENLEKIKATWSGYWADYQKKANRV